MATLAKVGGRIPLGESNRHQGANHAAFIALSKPSFARHPALPSLHAAEKNQSGRHWVPLERSFQRLRGASKRESPASGGEERPVISRIYVRGGLLDTRRGNARGNDQRPLLSDCSITAEQYFLLSIEIRQKSNEGRKMGLRTGISRPGFNRCPEHPAPLRHPRTAAQAGISGRGALGRINRGPGIHARRTRPPLP